MVESKQQPPEGGREIRNEVGKDKCLHQRHVGIWQIRFRLFMGNRGGGKLASTERKEIELRW